LPELLVPQTAERCAQWNIGPSFYGQNRYFIEQNTLAVMQRASKGEDTNRCA